MQKPVSLCTCVTSMQPWQVTPVTTVADATGKPESGLLDGNGFYEGRAPLCRRANERLADDDVVMTPHYCVTNFVQSYSGAIFGLKPLEPLNATRTDWVSKLFSSPTNGCVFKFKAETLTAYSDLITPLLHFPFFVFQWKTIWRGLGICIPDTCGEADAEILFRDGGHRFNVTDPYNLVLCFGSWMYIVGVWRSCVAGLSRKIA